VRWLNRAQGPLIASLSPSFGPIGTTVTITGSGFVPTGNVIEFSGNAVGDSVDSSNGTTITFMIPNSLYLLCSIMGRCPGPIIPIRTQTYNVAVDSNSQLSNSVPFTVTAGGPSLF